MACLTLKIDETILQDKDLRCVYLSRRVFRRLSIIKNNDYQAKFCNLKESETSRNLQYDIYTQNLHELHSFVSACTFVFVLPNMKPI